MAEYNYARTQKSDNSWDIDNNERLNVDGNQIHLLEEIQTAFPSWESQIICDGPSCKILADATCPNETTLNTIVNNHKNNV